MTNITVKHVLRVSVDNADSRMTDDPGKAVVILTQQELYLLISSMMPPDMLTARQEQLGAYLKSLSNVAFGTKLT